MRKMYLLGGLSALAFVATGANAQNANLTTSNGVGNTAACVNNTLGSTGNSCTITQDGDYNDGRVRQQGDNNTGTIDQNGSYSTASINQPGRSNFGKITQNDYYNSASIEQSGRNNSGTITQDYYFNNATIRQPGRAGTATIVQTGDQNLRSNIEQGNFDPGQGTPYDYAYDGGNGISQRNYASATQSAGSYNSFSDINQNGDDNTATVNQSGDNSDSFLYSYGNSNSAKVTETGSESVSLLIQYPDGVNNYAGYAGNSGDVTIGGSDNYSYVGQQGTNNSATVVLSGVGREKNRYSTSQDYAQNEAAESIVFQVGNGNSASVSQSGNGDSTEVNQGAFSNLGASGNNSASVTQSADTSTNRLDQDGFGHTATIVQALGSNLGSVATQHGGDNNGLFVSLSQGQNQRSDVDQNGSDNYAEVTMTDGLNGTNVNGSGPEANLSGRNTANIDQIGRGSVAVTTTGSNQNFQGVGNTVNITQNGSASFAGRGAPSANRTNAASEGRIAYTEFGRTGSSGNFTGSNGNYVETWQQGRFDTANVTQSANADAGHAYADGSVARARAGIYQSSSVGQVGVTQTGDNYGEVTQAFGQASQTTLNQTDAGDIATQGPDIITPVPDTCDAFGNCVPNPPIVTPGPISYTRQYNQALITQYGNSNVITATQNTRNGYLTAFQRVGSATNRTVVEQGTGSSAAFAGSGGVYAGNPISGTPQMGANTQNITANVEQGGANNANRVWQDGTNLFATVRQLGTGTARSTATDFTGFAANNAGNQVLVTQQGTGNRATAIQQAGVGSSAAGSAASGNSAAQNQALTGDPNATADEFYFAGGSRSAEIDILQGGANNTATAEQRGKGQYARIDQGPGSGNTASILQDVNATNATAVIRQSGSNNSYYVVQVAPGQYISVEQTGNGNSANNIVQRGAAGGSNGFTPPSGS